MKKILLICLIVFCPVGCDYSSKSIAKDKLKGQPVLSNLGGDVKLVYAENSEILTRKNFKKTMLPLDEIVG